jgi:hypothetical protein
MVIMKYLKICTLIITSDAGVTLAGLKRRGAFYVECAFSGSAREEKQN